MFHLPFVLLNLFAVTRNGSKKQGILMLSASKIITGRPTAYEHTIHKLSCRAMAVLILPLGPSLLLSREPPRRTVKLVELEQPKVSCGNKQLWKSPWFTKNQIILSAQFISDADMNGFPGQVFYLWRFSCFDPVAPKFLIRLPLWVPQLGRNQLQHLRWALRCLSLEITFAPWPGLVTEPCFFASGWEEPSSMCPQRKEPDTEAPENSIPLSHGYWTP